MTPITIYEELVLERYLRETKPENRSVSHFRTWLNELRSGSFVKTLLRYKIDIGIFDTFMPLE
jgi:hypothetical protein